MILSQPRIQEILSGIAGRRVAVVGDVMLDKYYRGTVTRISPEAPVPIVNVIDEAESPGGAANVAYNLATLGAEPVLLGVVGDDAAGGHLRRLLNTLGINGDGLVVDPMRSTTMKGRVIADNQQIVRIDHETTSDIGGASLKRLLDIFESSIGDLDAVILQDYNKGVVVEELIAHVIDIAKRHDVPVYVDPKRHNFFRYTDVDVFKPNRKEAEEALHMSLSSHDQLREGVRILQEKLRCNTVVLTLGAEGMLLAERDSEPVIAGTKALQVSDVSGAGDTVIATLSASRAAGATMFEAALVANQAAGIVCGKSGTVPIDLAELFSVMMADHVEADRIVL